MAETFSYKKESAVSVPERHFNHIKVTGAYNRAGEFLTCIDDVCLRIGIPGTDMDKDKSAG
jgi:hypothetical protein